MKLHCILLLLPAVAVSQTGHSAETVAGTLLLKSGFEAGVTITADMNRITGSDFPGFAWEATPLWEGSRFADVIGRGKKVADFMESVIERHVGPNGSQTNVLRLINKAEGYMKKHPREGRVYFAVNRHVVLDTEEAVLDRLWSVICGLRSVVPLSRGPSGPLCP